MEIFINVNCGVYFILKIIPIKIFNEEKRQILIFKFYLIIYIIKNKINFIQKNSN